ncbi:Ubiquitin-conjugating enzyme subunit [Oleoguttula sp. CCFEE 5521]
MHAAHHGRCLPLSQRTNPNPNPNPPEVSSPANVDAGVMLRLDPKAYKERVKQGRERSKEDIPTGFEMPTHESAFKKEEPVADTFSWSDSEGGDEFGSDVDEEMFDDDDEDGEAGSAADSDEDA